MNQDFAKFVVVSLMLPGLFACDEAEFVGHDGELLALGLYNAEPPRIREAESLERHQLEPAKQPLGPLVEDEGPSCGPSQVSTPAELCPPWRQVGRFNGACPAPYVGDPPPDGHWVVDTMFSGLANPLAGLGGFCRYRWTGDPAAVAALPPAIAANVGPDCRVFAQSPMASTLEPAYARAFEEGTAPLPSKPSGGAGVKIAVIDTAPANTSVGQAGHGQAMAAIAGELAAGCVPGLGESSKGCKRQVRTYLGLPQTRTGPDYDNGGFYGYQSELAEGIAQALDQWPDPNAGDQKLILNLSVGWEPTTNEFHDPEPAVEAIRNVLAVGQCRGALIIAASGNRPPGTCFGDATGPGGWEREPGYDQAKCQSLGLPEGAIVLPNPLPAYHPFLYAATPLDWRRTNLADLRTGSNARLAATGFAGFDEVRNVSYGPLTGSSVSTAVISGTAALAWSYFDGLYADEIMALLYDAGASTGGDVSLDLGSNSPAQHQVTACGTMSYACDPSRIGNYLRGNQGQPTACDPGLLSGCMPTSPTFVDQAAWSSAYTLAFGQLSSQEYENSMAPAWHTLECAQCGGMEITHIPDVEGARDSEPEHMGWVLPQPHKPPCPHCQIKGPDLYLSLDPVYDTFVLEDYSVQLYDATGASEQLHYDPARLTAALSSTSVEVMFDTQLQTVSPNQPPIKAIITMTFTDPSAGPTAGPITASNSLTIN